MTRRAAELTWVEVAEQARAGAWALLPVGSTEAHGPHLPLNTDVVIAEAVCERVCDRLEARGGRALIFPALPYGLTEFAAAFAGTVSVPGELVTAALRQACLHLHREGFARIGIVNHHLEPAHFAAVKAAAEQANAQGARVACPDHRRRPWAIELGEEFCRGGSHAGCYETSLVLAAAPRLVRDPIRLALPPLEIDLAARIKAGAADFQAAGGPQAYFGHPEQATPQEGERLLGILAEAALSALDALQ